MKAMPSWERPDEVDLGNVGPAQPPGAVDDRAENGVDVGRGATQRREHFTGGGELFPCLGKVASEVLLRGDAALVPVYRHNALLVPPRGVTNPTARLAARRRSGQDASPPSVCYHLARGDNASA